jgi:hypothetical protein
VQSGIISVAVAVAVGVYKKTKYVVPGYQNIFFGMER